ncbi:MAG: hypothetical protein AAGF66_02035 [Cyanobacteria bacterium P01_H01_bin.119]
MTDSHSPSAASLAQAKMPTVLRTTSISMTHAIASFPAAPDLMADAYVVVGLATCFVRADGEISPVTVAEPVPSAYLEALFKGVPTAYQSLHGLTLEQVVSGDSPRRFADMAEAADFCPDFVSRAFAAARTYQSRPVAKSLVPPGTCTSEVNYSTERKRILNADHIVRVEDNVKQHEYTHKVL